MKKLKERHWRFQRQSVVTLTDGDKTSGGGWEDWGSAKSRWEGRVENNTRRICLRNALPNSVSIGGKYFQQEEDWSLHIKASQLATRTNKLVFPDPKNVPGVNSLAIISSFPGQRIGQLPSPVARGAITARQGVTVEWSVGQFWHRYKMMLHSIWNILGPYHFCGRFILAFSNSRI